MPFTYAEVGATAVLPLPHGYSHLRYRTKLGNVSFDDVAEAVTTFALHRAAGFRIETDAKKAEVGAKLTVVAGAGPIKLVAPCQIVAVFDDPRRRGFSYGTLDGHPERGEEAFFVSREGYDIWFEVRAFSRPARWYTRMGEAFVPFAQRAYAWQLGRTLRSKF